MRSADEAADLIVDGIVEQPKPPRAWYIAITLTGGLTLVLFAMLFHLITTGVGVWGVNSTVGWGWAIVNFVFWVGIGHAGTLISAILFLLRQKWRTSINRFAEAMTIFAVICAGIFPGIHVGRVWVAYWLAPLPNQMALWPNFKSPLLWDVFAVTTYALVSILVSVFGATLPERLGPRRAVTIALSNVLIGLAILAAFPTIPALWIAAVFVGFGMAFNYPSLNALTVNRVSDADRASAISSAPG